MIKERNKMNTDTMAIDYYMNLPYKTEVKADKCDGTPCFTAYNPELKGCMAFGPTWRDAIASLKEARRQYIEAALELGWEVPVPKQTAEMQPSDVHVSFRTPVPRLHTGVEFGTKVPA